MKKFFFKIARFTSNLVLALLLVVILGSWALRSTWAQNRLIPQIESLLENQLGAPVQIGELDLSLPAHVILRQVAMQDQRGAPMFSFQELRADLLSFSLLKMLFQSSAPIAIRVNQIELQHPTAHIYRSRTDSSFNFAFLASNQDTTTSEGRPLDLDLRHVVLQQGEVVYVDSTYSDEELAIANRLNYHNMHLQGLNTRLAFHLLPNQNMQGEIKSFEANELRSQLRLDKLKAHFELFKDDAHPGVLQMCFNNVEAAAGKTHLQFDGELRNARPDSVTTGFFPAFSANFQPSAIDMTTLNYLLPKPLPMQGVVRLEGLASGDLQGIYSDSLHVGMYENTQLAMALALTDYTSADDLGMDFDIEQGTLSFDELQQFFPETDIPLRGIVQLKGKVKGDLHQLRTRDLFVTYGKQTDLFVKAHLTDYTEGDNIIMDAKFKNSHFSFSEIRQLIPAMELPLWMDRFGRTEINGKFIGGVSDFVVDAQVTSKYGQVDANLQLILPPKRKDIFYNGWVKTQNLDFQGMEADLPVQLQNVNFDGKIRGNGTSWGTMNADIDGKLVDTKVEGFQLDRLVTDSLRIRGYSITGGCKLTDTEGNASFSVDMNIPDTARHKINLFGDVKNVDLAHYGILPQDSAMFSAIVNLRLRGDSLENYEGNLRFYLLQMLRENTADTLNVSRFVLNSKFNAQQEHLLELKSSLLNMKMRGAFAYSKALHLISRLSKEARLYIKNNDTLTSRYYAEKVVEPENIVIWDTIQTRRDLNDVLSFFKVPAYVGPGTKMVWKLEHGLVDRVDLDFVADSLAYSMVGFKGNSLQLHVDKDGSQNELIAAADLEIDTLNIGDRTRFKRVLFRPNGDNTEINYDLQASQPDIGNSYIVEARTNFLPGGRIVSTILPKESVLDIKGKQWHFAPGNMIVRKYSRPPSLPARVFPDSVISRFFVTDLSLSNQGQRIAANGVVSRDFLDILTVRLNEIEIGSLLEVLESPLEFDGKINEAQISGYDLLTKQPTLAWNVNVEDFKYQEKDSIGIRLRGGWPQDAQGEIAKLRLEFGHWGKDSVLVKGLYNVVQDSLALEADSSSILLSWLTPFVEGVLSDMQGSVSVDRFSVNGKISNPRLDGVAHLHNAGFKVDYLNSAFRIGNNSLTFNNGKVEVPEVVIRDDEEGRAVLSGDVTFDDNAGTVLDLHVNRIRNLKVMDTRKGMNPDFYGRIVLDGDSARVTGPISLPYIEAWVNTGDGSWMDIPLSDYTSASRLDYVNFVRKGDTTRLDSMLDLGGVRMTLTVNARPNAPVRLIFDEKVGDIIEARGAGAITLDITEAGDFNMFGAYVLESGNYLFTAENIVNKKFLVEPGGRIVWNGSPYDAVVNLDAVYQVSADISDLAPNSTSHRVPVEIVMHMKGSLMQPEIDLELRLDQLNSQDVLGIASYFRGIQYDQQELNKQVVSLLLFRRFTRSSSSTNTFAGVGVTSSISELISNQVNYWISQAFENANLGVELNTNEFQDVELALSASLFNNRVTVERNGTIIGNSGNSFSIGDLKVLIKLLPKPNDTSRSSFASSGQLVMEIFNREDATIQTANNVSRGVGVFYKKDFDRISDLLIRKKKKDISKKELKTPE